VFIGVPVAQSVDLCGVLWTIVVHPVFIGVPVAQSVDLCGVLWTMVNNNGPQNTTQIYRLNNRSPNKYELNNNGPLLFTPCLMGFLLVNL
jgi:hypothetical protein